KFELGLVDDRSVCAPPAGWSTILGNAVREPSRQIELKLHFMGAVRLQAAGSSEESYAYLARCIAAAVVGSPQQSGQIRHPRVHHLDVARLHCFRPAKRGCR